jgi:hypothetical protein
MSEKSQEKLEIRKGLPEVRRVKSAPKGSKFERADIFAALEKYGIEKPSPELLHDLIMVLRKLKVKEDSEISFAVCTLVRSSRSFFDLRRWGFKDEEKNHAVRYNLYVADFLRRLNLASIPGRTDKDKAISLAMMAGELRKAFEAGVPSEDLANNLENAYQSASDLKPEELATLALLPHPTGSLVMQAGPDPDDPSLTEKVDGVEVHRAEILERDPARTGFNNLRQNMQLADIATRLTTDKKLGTVLDVARNLRGRVGLGTSRSNTLILDKEGAEFVLGNIRSADEIHYLLPSERILGGIREDLLLHRIVTGDALVRRRASRVRKRQLLYCLIDGSGSMRCGQSIQMAAGVMMNRLSAVARGDGVLFYRFFDAKLSDEYLVTDPASVSEHLRRVLSFPYNVEKSHLQEAVTTTLERMKQIEREGEYDRPHLLVISDGDAKFDIPVSLLRGSVVHAVLIDGRNEGLEKIVKYTGGTLVKLGTVA